MVRVVVPRGGDDDEERDGTVDVNEDDLGIYEDADDGSDLTDHDVSKAAETDVDDCETFRSATTVGAINENVISVSISDRADPQRERSVFDDECNGGVSGQSRVNAASNKFLIKEGRSGILKKRSNKGTLEGESEGRHGSQSLMFSNVDTGDNDQTLVMSSSDVFPPFTPGTRAKANTPASMYTEWTELRDLDSRDAMYKKAVKLMMNRCASRQQQSPDRSGHTPLICYNNPTFGSVCPRYFYIHQSKPVPMPPLKAWRGYHGNVYFEPIKVNQAKVDSHPNPPRFRAGLRNDALAKVPASHNSTRSSIDSRNSNSYSIVGSKSSSPLLYRKMAILDKGAVINQSNTRLHEDILWIKGQESVGSLKVEQKVKKKKVHFSKEKIVKGSVAKSMSGNNPPVTLLSVSGGRCAPPPRAPPFMRAQTQYSKSTRRMLTNTPEVSLLPFEEVRLRLRHADTNNETIVHIIPPLERYKYNEPHYKPCVRFGRENTTAQNSARSAAT